MPQWKSRGQVDCTCEMTLLPAHCLLSLPTLNLGRKPPGLRNDGIKLAAVANVCNPCTRETEAGGTGGSGWPGPQSQQEPVRVGGERGNTNELWCSHSQIGALTQGEAALSITVAKVPLPQSSAGAHSAHRQTFDRKTKCLQNFLESRTG
jgi:hypothetical protein